MRCRNAGFGELCLELIRRFTIIRSWLLQLLHQLACFDTSLWDDLCSPQEMGLQLGEWAGGTRIWCNLWIQIIYLCHCAPSAAAFISNDQEQMWGFLPFYKRCFYAKVMTRSGWQRIPPRDVMILWKKMEKGAVTEGTRCCQVTMLASWSKDFKISGRGWDVTVRDDAFAVEVRICLLVFFWLLMCQIGKVSSRYWIYDVDILYYVYKYKNIYTIFVCVCVCVRQCEQIDHFPRIIAPSSEFYAPYHLLT